MSIKLPYLKGRSNAAQISLFATLFLLEMAATKRSAIDREYIPDSDSESDFSLDSDSDIDVSDCSSLNPASNYHTKLHF